MQDPFEDTTLEPFKISSKQTTMKVHIKTKSSRQKMADIYVDGHFKGKGSGPFPVSICAKLVEAETRYGIYASKTKRNEKRHR